MLVEFYQARTSTVGHLPSLILFFSIPGSLPTPEVFALHTCTSDAMRFSLLTAMSPRSLPTIDALGVDPSADALTIEQAFSQKSLQYSSDRPTGNEEKFKLVNAAYKVLGDDLMRQLYDAHGDEPLKILADLSVRIMIASPTCDRAHVLAAV